MIAGFPGDDSFLFSTDLRSLTRNKRVFKTAFKQWWNIQNDRKSDKGNVRFVCL